jgi:predicted RNase H-like HicB family nuclease
MAQTYTAVITERDDWWIGWVEEIPGVNCQEKTRAELLETLSVTLKEALDFNRHEALQAAGEPYEEELIQV